MEHTFTSNIKSILEKHFDKYSDEIFERSLLIQYINFKTVSANKGSKARSSFANLYAIYVIIEDYINKGFHKKANIPNTKVQFFLNCYPARENYYLEANCRITR